MEIEEIIRAIKRGEKNALAKLMEKHQQYVYGILISILTKNEAEEAAQDTFIKVYNRIDSYNHQSKFTTWLYSIAYRTGLDYIRKRKRTEQIDGAILTSNYIRSEETITKEIEGKELKLSIDGMLSTLPSEDTLLLKLYYLEERKLKEVAEICGISESNAKVKLYRIRKTLREKRFKLAEL